MPLQQGDDVYGRWMREVLRGEGVAAVEPVAAGAAGPADASTLLCFVLVAPGGKHAFCSRYDFGPWPLLTGVRELPPGMERMLQDTQALFINGAPPLLRRCRCSLAAAAAAACLVPQPLPLLPCALLARPTLTCPCPLPPSRIWPGFCFDELSPEAVLSAARTAAAAGAAVFFDPGPRSWTFAEGERQAALAAMLDAADVVCMTEEEAAAVTGLQGAEAQARWVLGRPGARTEWVIIKRGGDGALLATRSGGGAVFTQQALRVDVRDTGAPPGSGGAMQ